jgi:hypothetical protein
MGNSYGEIFARALAVCCGAAMIIFVGAWSSARAADPNGPGAAVTATILIPTIPPGGSAGSDDVQVNAKTNRI